MQQGTISFVCTTEQAIQILRKKGWNESDLQQLEIALNGIKCEKVTVPVSEDIYAETQESR